MEKTIAPQVYGADEINAFVLDPGSDTIQGGYAGNDQPTLILPSYYGIKQDKSFEFDENVLYSGNVEEIKPMRNGNEIFDINATIAQIEYFIKNLKIDPKIQPLLLTESTLSKYEDKVKLLNYAFMERQFCAMYLIKQPTCSSFAHGRPNCLVVDIGHSLVTVTPVIDGLCLKNHVKGTNFAGNFLNQQLKELLVSKNIDYVPPFKVKSKNVTYWENNESKPNFESKDGEVNESVIDFSFERTLREMKELLLEVCMDDEIVTESNIDSDDTRWFELPNGLNIPFTKQERQKISNSLFNPSDLLVPLNDWDYSLSDGDIISHLVNKSEVTSKDYVPLRRTKRNEGDADADGDDEEVDDENETPTPSINQSTTTSNQPIGLSKLIQSSLDSLDIDLKPQLANNIVLTGSTSLIARLNERINNELIIQNPSLKIRVHSAGNTIERKYSTWIGGSIISSLGTFHQMWVSNTEYQDIGHDQLITNRFR